MASVSAPEFWTDLYARGGDGWELRQPAPPLVEVMDLTPPAPGRVAVPGCGRGHDVRFLARRGFSTVGFDFSVAAVAAARELAKTDNVSAEFVERDIFTLGGDYARAFDGIWEYTCFCAIDPDRRAEYAQVLQAILRPGGTLLACFYPLRAGTDGPPFPVSREGIETVLEPCFRIVEAGAPPASPERRRNLEWFGTAERRAP